MVLIPGWATDYKIFNTLKLDYNYLLPLNFSPFNFEKDLRGFLDKKRIERISLLGWSLGGFLAYEFAARNSERIDDLILLSIRKKFDSALLKEIGLKIKKNKRGYLYKFYIDCFCGDEKEELIWFKKNLMKDYISEIKIKELLLSLDYLSAAGIEPKPPGALRNISVFHGANDRIAPINEAREISSKLPQAKFVCIEGAGHIPFLNRRFAQAFYNG